jgi:hypothetical protein
MKRGYRKAIRDFERVVVRVCELEVGDYFETDGQRFRVTEIKDGRLYYGRFRNGKPYFSRWQGKWRMSRGSRSMLFVYLIKSKHEQTSGMVEESVRSKGNCDGPGTGTGDDR